MVPDWIIQQIGEPPPKPPTDPEAYAAFPWEAKEAWREWNRKEDQLINKGFEQGLSLEEIGYKNAPDEGKSVFARYGQNGFYMQNGANADPNWRYDWATGRKYNIATSDQNWNKNNPNGVPISASEYEGYKQMQGAKGQGATTYSQVAGKEAVARAVSQGHFTQQSNGLLSNIGKGDPNNPATWEWINQWGQHVDPNNGSVISRPMPGGSPWVGGQAAGISSLNYGGEGAFGGGGMGSSAFGGGFGGSYTPGQEASAFSQADVNSALAEQMRNDILQQQVGLQKNLEGHALGQGIYDYLLNGVYGKVLGAQFQGNQQGVSQYTQGLQQGMGSSPTYNTPAPVVTGGGGGGMGYFPPGATTSNAQGEMVTDYPYTNNNYTAQAGGVMQQQNPLSPVQYAPDPRGGGGSIPSYTDSRGQIHYMDYTTQNPADPSTWVTPDREKYLNGASGAPTSTASSFDVSASAPNWQQNAQTYQVPSGQIAPGKASGTQMGQTNSSGGSVGIANAAAASAANNPAAAAAAAQGPTPERAAQIQAINAAALKAGEISQQQFDQRSTQLQTLMQGQTTKSGGTATRASAQPLPTGSYTQTGTDSLDPNMSSTWATFLAPTWGKINQGYQQQLNALDRSGIRGGEMDRAKADATAQRYGALQSGWQSLVPGALQGISDIGKEMYFQAPTANSGAAQTMAGIQQGNQQYSLGLQQMKSNEKLQGDAIKAQKDASNKGFFGSIGSSLLGAAGTAAGAGLFSDERTKKNVEPFSYGLKALKGLDPVSYEYNGKAGTTSGQPGVSVMAQQLEKVMPEAVSRVKTPDGEYRMIDPIAISMATVNAVKELDKKISALGRKK